MKKSKKTFIIKIKNTNKKNDGDKILMPDPKSFKPKSEEQKGTLTLTVYPLDKELLEFATWFSENYTKLSVSEYWSREKKYCIYFYENMIDKNTGQEITCPVCVKAKSGRMEFNRCYLISSEKVNADFVFYIVLWCYIRCKVNSEVEADIKTLQYYITTKRSSKAVLLGLLDLFKTSGRNMLMNKTRYKGIKSFEKFKKKSNAKPVRKNIKNKGTC